MMKLTDVDARARDIETLAAKFHEIYQQEAKRQGDVRHKDAYADLSENIKEFDRVLARYVLEVTADLQRENAELQAKLSTAKDRYERAETQLAGCGAAALGWNDKPAKQGDWGWSASYQDVLTLRRNWEGAKAKLAPGPCPQKHPAMFWQVPDDGELIDDPRSPDGKSLTEGSDPYCELCLTIEKIERKARLYEAKWWELQVPTA